MSPAASPKFSPWSLLACLVPFAVPLLLMLAGEAARAGLIGIWGWYLTPLLVFGLVPLGDRLLGRASSAALAGSRPPAWVTGFCRWLLRAWVPLQLALLLWGAQASAGLGLWEWLGLAVSIGICTGATGITLAHELMHRPQALDRRLSELLLLSVCYMHFYIEHLRGHHRHVATPGDPASARLGESFYAFYPRAVSTCWRSAWRIETQRLRKRSQPIFSRHNQMLWYVALPLLLAAGLGLAYGPMAAAFFFAQALVAFSLLELSNYVEHYGLSRHELRPGVYEPVRAAHSWNAERRLTGSLMFMLQRHSDHHAHPARPYQHLQSAPEAPQLPAGFAAMLLLALLPPLWRRVMDPLARQAMAEKEAPFITEPAAALEAVPARGFAESLSVSNSL